MPTRNIEVHTAGTGSFTGTVTSSWEKIVDL